MSNIRLNVGDKVRFIGNQHIKNPKFFPAFGTIGIIKEIGEAGCLIQWPKWSTSGNDCHSCYFDDIEKINNNNNNFDITNEEIWEMLKPKMEKNGVESKASIINSHIDDYPNNEIEIIKAYYEPDVVNAIAIAYRSGYERAMKGRPFKFGEKKKKGGHWVPVDSGNLPEEGTRVRYARETPSYKDHPEFITLGQTGTFARGKCSGNPGMKPDGNLLYPWVSFVNCSSCLDMWVEDDK